MIKWEISQCTVTLLYNSEPFTSFLGILCNVLYLLMRNFNFAYRVTLESAAERFEALILQSLSNDFLQGYYYFGMASCITNDNKIVKYP